MAEYFSYSDGDIGMNYRRDDRPVPSDFSMHTHESYELYYFAGGNGIYRVEGTPYPLEKGDILIMRPAEAHYIDIRDDKPYTRLSVNFNADLLSGIDPNGRLLAPFNNRKIGTLNRYRAENFKSDAYSIFIKNIITDSPDRRVQTITNLLPLLNEISLAFDSLSEMEITKSLDSRIISYINRHISEDITLDNICEKFYISKTHLCRIFKKATASTVGEYITVKRLVKARQLIHSGTPPTKVYLQCGFKDYSVFYRAYKKKYGIPPSAFTND
ncbi:MAG: AraC family transcriptional regulator [Acutalibacteraceae bacterium]